MNTWHSSMLLCFILILFLGRPHYTLMGHFPKLFLKIFLEDMSKILSTCHIYYSKYSGLIICTWKRNHRIAYGSLGKVLGRCHDIMLFPCEGLRGVRTEMGNFVTFADSFTENQQICPVFMSGRVIKQTGQKPFCEERPIRLRVPGYMPSFHRNQDRNVSS